MAYQADFESLAEYWQSFERRCVPDDASPAQRFDTQAAFFAGAISTLMLLDGAFFDPQASEEDKSARLAEIRKEIRAYTDPAMVQAVMESLVSEIH